MASYSKEDITNAIDVVKGDMDLTFNLKKEQSKVIRKIINKKHTFAILPTGYGKSMCFGLPPLVMDKLEPDVQHMAIVICPLRSLMINQVAQWQQRGVSAVAVLKSSEMEPSVIEGIKNVKYSLVLGSPEALMQRQWIDFCRQHRQNITLIACDEVHCFIQWGDSFRKAYKEVCIMRSVMTETPFLLLTATCTESLHRQICAGLLLDDDSIKTISIVPDRPNIFLRYHGQVEFFQVELQWLLCELKEGGVNTRKSIIYCRRTTHVYEIYGWLCDKLGYGKHVPLTDRIVTMYHGHITELHEKRVGKEFPKPDSKIRCVVSTIAFGMGVDIPDVRLIINWGASKTTLNFWQEIGRCSRDGQSGEAHLYTLGILMVARETDKEMVDVCGNADKGQCLREQVLSTLTIQGMDESRLEDLSARSDHESQEGGACPSDCGCKYCSCCSVCRNKHAQKEQDSPSK